MKECRIKLEITISMRIPYSYKNDRYQVLFRKLFKGSKNQKKKKPKIIIRFCGGILPKYNSALSVLLEIDLNTLVMLVPA